MQPDLSTSSVSRPRMSTDERAAALLLVDLRRACRCCYCVRFRRRRPARRTSGGTTQGRIREGSVLTVMVTSTATYKGETPWSFQRPCPPSPMSP